MAALEEAGPRADYRRVRQIRHLGRVVAELRRQHRRAEPVHLLPGRGPLPPPRIARRSRALRRRPPRLPDPPPTPPWPGRRRGNLSSTAAAEDAEVLSATAASSGAASTDGAKAADEEGERRVRRSGKRSRAGAGRGGQVAGTAVR
ncbi:hypothetical protein OsI_08666 [Oryza sativa Indica Group]|uniref:Uncharacterized protein n=1 Tax=Oryza sativa subsp. indica TaxID=39946 RepID=B8AHP8_ORYSI|nr:hypothetical protein OsI_08666 [Oryza sativa Indica Group]